MGGLLSTLLQSANALDSYQRVLQVTQNNVANSSTPGYAKQSLTLEAQPFDPAAGKSGGVQVGELQSARNEYAEQAVRRQTSTLGQQQQAAASLTSLQAFFDISGNTGLPNALNQFYQSASAWAQSPNSGAVRQTVLDRATDVAHAFQGAAAGIQTVAQDTETQLRSTVDRVNQLVGQIRGYNQLILQNGASAGDAGMDAKVHAALENLSQLVSFSASRQDDGTTTVLLNGATPLLIGDRQYAIQLQMSVPADPPPTVTNAPPTAQLLASDGTDVTARTTDGQLGALLDMRNRILPSYMGDGTEAGALNLMAQEFADRVNGLLQSGQISDGPPPVAGLPLFTYDTVHVANAASSLAVVPTLTPDRLAAIDPGPPYVSNGIPLALSHLASPTDPADMIDGVSYSEFYGGMAARVGSELQSARDGQQVQQSLVAQAKSQRDQLSGVSLDEEAMILVEFQRAYQANARFLTVLDQLTAETINILR
jgi:flagellar hook-associated protein 1